jgi:hypothetical protein
MSVYDIMFIVVGVFMGSAIGFYYCNLTYIRYKKTIDSMRVIEIFKSKT